MDLEYLFFLQGIRESMHPFFTQFFLAVSAIATSTALILIPCVLFWCLDKRNGLTLVFGFSMGSLCNQFLKNTVSCYRPWIRSSASHPVSEALPDATGYSFPSGHTQAASSLFGGLGWLYRKRMPVLNVLCWVFVLLVAFSRNFLGVHTPQDVIVGLLEGIVFIVAGGALLDWIDAKEGRDRTVLVVALVISVAYLLYVTFKPYPMDYDANGVLLVDPVAMQVDCFKSGGLFVGLFLGWFLERRLVGFEVDPKALGGKGIAIRLVVGIVVVLALHLLPRLLSPVLADARLYELVKYFLTAFAAVFVAPLAFTALERRLA